MDSILDVVLEARAVVNNANGTAAAVNIAGFPTPDLPNEGYKVWLALVIMIIVSSLFVTSRIATRISTGQMGADDYAIVAALLSCVVQTTLWALAVRTGYGADYLLLNSYQRRLFNEYWYLGSIFYPLTIGLFKSSVILLNKRIFVQRGFQIACWITLVINSCWALGNILGWFFQCIPMESMWGAAPAEKCWDMNGLWISIVTWDVTSDVWILAMVIPMVWKLNLKVREKALLTGVFCLGAVVIVFSVMSCSAVSSGLNRQHGETNQVTFALANLFQVLESNMGIIGACLPVMRQPLRQYLPRLFGTAKSGKPSYYTDDRFVDQYVLQNVSGSGKKQGSQGTWHDVSISANRGQHHKSPSRESDELRIIDGMAEMERGDAHGSGELVDMERRSRSPRPDGIRKDVVVSVDRI